MVSCPFSLKPTLADRAVQLSPGCGRCFLKYAEQVFWRLAAGKQLTSPASQKETNRRWIWCWRRVARIRKGDCKAREHK